MGRQATVARAWRASSDADAAAVFMEISEVATTHPVHHQRSSGILGTAWLSQQRRPVDGGALWLTCRPGTSAFPRSSLAQWTWPRSRVAYCWSRTPRVFVDTPVNS